MYTSARHASVRAPRPASLSYFCNTRWLVSRSCQPYASTGETRMSHEHDDNDTNESSNPTFESVLTKRVSRREMFGNVAGAAALVAVGAAASEQRQRPGRRWLRRQLRWRLRKSPSSAQAQFQSGRQEPRRRSHAAAGLQLRRAVRARRSDRGARVRLRQRRHRQSGDLRVSRRRPSRRHVLLRHGRRTAATARTTRRAACCA